jgi:hypothetical protein
MYSSLWCWQSINSGILNFPSLNTFFSESAFILNLLLYFIFIHGRLFWYKCLWHERMRMRVECEIHHNSIESVERAEFTLLIFFPPKSHNINANFPTIFLFSSHHRVLRILSYHERDNL